MPGRITTCRCWCRRGVTQSTGEADRRDVPTLPNTAPRGRMTSLARLALHGITKRYPTVLANDGIDLCVRIGEIHAVMGENGAGKSTLMKIVYGVTRPDSGHIEWEGRPVVIDNPAAARRLGIGMVFQHFALFETLSVAENIAWHWTNAWLLPRWRRASARWRS